MTTRILAAWTLRTVPYLLTSTSRQVKHHDCLTALWPGFRQVYWDARQTAQLHSAPPPGMWHVIADFATAPIVSFSSYNMGVAVAMAANYWAAGQLAFYVRSLILAQATPKRKQYIMNSLPEILNKLPADVVDKLTANMASLDAALLASDPLMPNHLRNIHALLISYPETVHLLDDAEIAQLINAAELHTKVSIIKSVAAKPASSRKTKVTADDL